MPDTFFNSLLENNPYFTAGVGVVGFGAGLAAMRRGLVLGAELTRRRLLATLEIHSKDVSYMWFLQWMSQQSARRTHRYAVQTSFVQHDNGSVSTAFSLVPGPGRHYFKWKGAWFQIERHRDKAIDLITTTPFETVTLTTLSRDRHLFTELLHESREIALAKQEGKTVIYTSWGPEWKPFGLPRKRRLLSSVILDEGVKERIVTDVEEFIGNGKWYSERGIPYRRGYLLYGPPGSGKSSFIQALAGELGYNICILNLGERALTDDRLNHLLSNAPERSILLLEDIDAAFTSRKLQDDGQGYPSMVTFSGLLNALDGVAASEERIIFMTTNHVERLDQALIRPGRIDLKEYFGNATDYQIKHMFLRFYENEQSLADEFVKKTKGRAISPAQLQGHFVYYKNNPKQAVEMTENVFQSW